MRNPCLFTTRLWVVGPGWHRDAADLHYASPPLLGRSVVDDGQLANAARHQLLLGRAAGVHVDAVALHLVPLRLVTRKETGDEHRPCNDPVAPASARAGHEDDFVLLECIAARQPHVVEVALHHRLRQGPPRCGVRRGLHEQRGNRRIGRELAQEGAGHVFDHALAAKGLVEHPPLVVGVRSPRIVAALLRLPVALDRAVHEASP
mmetsp:Transcript_4014/g.14182  ORF Transcript_4014/g.14182 Transcript_4014/m.14182 type:complete len:205 (+) Transcript_4014:1034-1648(+)